MNWMVWAFIGIAFVFGIGLIVRFVMQEEEDEEEQPEGYDGDVTQVIKGDDDTLSETLSTTSEEFRGARKSRMIALKESLEASLETRHGMESASSKDRMTMPWFMLIGGEGSGKTTLLANTGLPLPYGPAFEVDSKKKDAGRWWLYEDAVVLEAPAAAPGATATGTTLTPEQTQAANTSEGWNTLLHMLRRERPDSPLNGIIVTVSAPDLLASRRDPEKLTDQAERIRIFLERTRRVLGVRLPLHLLITKCDTLPGFKSFAHNLPQGRRHDIFGWANPNKLETPFNPDWIDLGIAAMRDSLDDLRDELLAAPDEIVDSDGLFVFVSEFAELHEPLKEFATKLIGEGERRPSLFFRGMYFSGDAIEKVEAETAEEMQKSGPRATIQISSEATMGGQTSGHNLVFLRSLFRDKIFREAGLAKPVARFRLSRDRRVVIAQAAAVAFLVIGGAGLWTALNGYRRGEVLRPGLRHDAEAVAEVLAGMAIDIDEVKRGAGGPDSIMDRRLRDAAVIELVGEMRGVESIRKSPFIPASWFSPLPGEIRRSMVAGIESIVLPVSRQRLEERIDRLLTHAGEDSTAVTTNGFETSDPRSLTEYLNEVKALSRNIQRYNTLATRDSGSVAQLGALLDYLFAERPLEGDSNFTSADFQSALRQASAPRIVVTPAMAQSVVTRSVGMIAAVARTAAQQLAPRTSAAAERTVKPEDDLLALRGLGALVDLSDPKTGLVGTVSDSAILGLRLARIVEDSIASELRLAALRVGRDTVSPATAEARLREAIARLFKLRFMERSNDGEVIAEIRPNERLRWDVGRLELVLALRGEFDQALFTVAPVFPGQAADRMRRAFQVQLRARAIDVAASSQRFTQMAVADSGLEVRTSAANLELAAPRISRASILLDTLNAAGEGRKLLAAGSRQAEQAIAMTHAMFEGRRYFEPHTARIAGWNGLFPLKFAALNIINNDSLTAEITLLKYVSDITTLARDVQPAVNYLRRPGVDSTRIPKLLAEWENVGVQVGRWERGESAGTLGQLHKFVRDEMAMRDVPACAAAVATPDTIKASTDVFVVKRKHYRAAMAGRCGNAGPEAASAYGRLRSLFASRLAGKFPFADTAQAGAPDVDVASLREWLRQYDAFVAAGHNVALRSDPRLAGPALRAMGFLDQAAQVRTFFAPLADGERRPPEYTLVVGEGDMERVQRWVYGEPITLFAPEDSVGNRAEVKVTGPWSALKAARGGRGERVRIHHPDTKAYLGLPVFPVVAQEIARPR